MLGLTRKTDYALIALTHMVRAGDCVSSAREMATCYRMPLPLLMNVLKALTHSGLVRSSRGPKGGYTLAGNAEDITLSQLIDAIEGQPALVQCARDHDEPEQGCDLVDVCPIRSPVHKVHNRLQRFLHEITLADIAGRGSENGEAADATTVAQSNLGVQAS